MKFDWLQAVKAKKSQGLNCPKQNPVMVEFPLARLDGPISAELREIWETKLCESQRQSKTQSPPLYEQVHFQVFFSLFVSCNYSLITNALYSCDNHLFKESMKSMILLVTSQTTTKIMNTKVKIQILSLLILTCQTIYAWMKICLRKMLVEP